MHSLSEHQLLLGLVALATILLFARTAGELARRVGQPEVLGELLAGFLLGPSIFGAFLPSLYHTILLDPVVSLVLSGFAWVGAILLLLIAGMEVDLAILRREAKPGVLAAASAIVPSLIAGSLFAWWVLGKTPPNGIFLGIVLSVTAVSVAAKVLIERGSMRRQYAQVILAAGVASEVLVWLFVSVISSLHSSSPVLAGLRSTVYAIAFFLFMMTIGRRITFRAMRFVRDEAWLIKGQLSLVLILTFLSAAITQALGLHALLGAFVFGVLLSQAPRATEPLIEGVQSLTIGLFGPVFFVLAGMRVNILQLGSLSAIRTVLLLFVVATAVKVGFSYIGARLGGQRGWEAALIGVGLNLKGGSDVVVAVVGRELGLLSSQAYTMYTIVGILTVLLSPPLLAFLEGKAPPTEDESARLESEEAARRAYVPRIERVLVPVVEPLLPSLAASVVERIAASKHEQGQIFDITEFDACQAPEERDRSGAREAHGRLQEASSLKAVEVTERRARAPDPLQSILDMAADYDLVAIGGRPPATDRLPSLGDLQDAIIHSARTDVLVAVDHESDRFDCSNVNRILVPTNGLEYSMAAGDIAGALAESCDAELVLFHVVRSDMGEMFWRERDHRRLVENASGLMDELAFRVGRLGVRVSKKVQAGDNAGEEIVRELTRERYELVVLGSVDRGADERPYLGRSVRTVLMKTRTPAILLVSRR